MKIFILSVLSFALISNADDFYKTGGRRVDNLYDLTVFTPPGNSARRVISIPGPVSDAWVYTVTGNSAEDTVTYKINGKEAHIHRPDPLDNHRGAVYMAPIQGFSEGENEIQAENVRGKAFMFVIRLKTGDEIVTGPGDGWLSGRGDGKWVKIKAEPAGEKNSCNYGTARPYGGLIEISSPGKRMPVFTEGGTITQDVTIPKDFYGMETPVLNFELENCWTKERPAWAAGNGIKGRAEGDRLVHRLEIPAEARGAYTAFYSFGPKEGHRRKAELIVVGKIPQEKVPPEDIYRSLRKELVDTIECADPSDPHKFAETGEYKGARIMEDELFVPGKGKETVKYRETGSWYGHASSKTSLAAWTAEIKDINRLYLLEFDYPDNRNRVLTAAVFNDDTAEYQAETTRICGGEFPLTNSVQTGQLLFYPRTHKITVLLANKESGSRAAAVRFRIYKILSERLPMADVSVPGDKLYMELNERSLASCGDMYPGSDYAINLCGFGGYLREGHDQLRRVYLAMENLICYIRFCGENGYMPGSIMYNRENYPSKHSPHIKTDGIGLLAEMLSANDLNLALMSHYFTDFTLFENNRRTGNGNFQRWIDKNLSGLKDSSFSDPVALVDNSGRAIPMHDISHPAVRRGYLDALREQTALYGGYGAFKGIMVFVSKNSVYGVSFPGLTAGFGDGTAKRFKEQSGSALPGFTGPERFQLRYDWIMKNDHEKWTAFKCETVSSLMREAAKIVAGAGNGAKLFVTPVFYEREPFGSNAGELAEKNASHHRSFGFDAAALKNIPNLVLNNFVSVSKRRTTHEKRSPEWFMWRCYSESAQDFLYNGADTGAVLSGSYWENHFDWPDRPIRGNFDKSLIGSAGGAHENYMHQLNLCMAGFGASHIFNQYTDCGMSMGGELCKALFAKVFAAVPPGVYPRIAGSNDYVTGRVQAGPKPSLLYVANLRAFDTKIKLSAAGADSVPSLTDILTGEKLMISEGAAAFSLKSYETKVLKCAGLKTVGFESITPDPAQIDAYKKQELKGDSALELSVCAGDFGQTQLMLRNTGSALGKNLIKITRHDGDPSLENTTLSYGPLNPGEKQIIPLPGALGSDSLTIEGIVRAPAEILPFKASGKKVLFASPAPEKIEPGGAGWDKIKLQTVPLHIRVAGLKRVAGAEEEKDFPDINIGFKAAWDKDGLYMLLDIPDKELVRNDISSGRLWAGDSAGIFLDLDPAGDCMDPEYSDDDAELIFAPPDGRGRKEEMTVSGAGLKKALAANPGLIQWKSRLTKTGYTVEIKIAGKGLKDFSVHPGKAVGFDIRLNALDSSDASKSYSNPQWNRRYYEWHNRSPQIENHESVRFFGLLVLAPPEGTAAPSPEKFSAPPEEKSKDEDSKILYSNDFETADKSVSPSQMKIERVERKDFPEGKLSLRAASEPRGKRKVSGLNFPKFSAQPGRTYSFSVWIHAEKDSAASIGFTGGPPTGCKSWWDVSKDITLRPGWHKYSMTSPLVKTRTGEEINFAVPAVHFYQEDGVFYLDDVKVGEHGK